MKEYFSTSYQRLPDGRVKFTVATLTNGEYFSMVLEEDEALENLRCFARILGLVVATPL